MVKTELPEHASFHTKTNMLNTSDKYTEKIKIQPLYLVMVATLDYN
jgi:hypothetical protein